MHQDIMLNEVIILLNKFQAIIINTLIKVDGVMEQVYS